LRHGGIWGLRNEIANSEDVTAKFTHIDSYQWYWANRSCDIHITAIFDGIPKFPHPYGIFISSGARIGRNCVIFQQVTIGSNTIPDSRGMGFPSIGDDCYIGAGAKIIGNVNVGNNCRIGANCVVVDDVPDNSVVVMEKPRTIVKEKLDNKFYSYSSKLGWMYYIDGEMKEVTDKEILLSLEKLSSKN
jgi:serine O-acetyltransferase